MASDELCWRSANELATLIRRKKVSPVEVVDAVLERIARLNPRLNAYVTVTDDHARRAARAAERALTRKGVPIPTRTPSVEASARSRTGPSHHPSGTAKARSNQSSVGTVSSSRRRPSRSHTSWTRASPGRNCSAKRRRGTPSM